MRTRYLGYDLKTFAQEWNLSMKLTVPLARNYDFDISKRSFVMPNAACLMSTWYKRINYNFCSN